MSLLTRRVRGFRLLDLLALSLLVMLILGVYLAKTIAGRERAEIARIERQIAAEKARIRLLQAEVAHLEQPARMERLSSTYLGLQPLDLARETSAEELPEVIGPPPMEVAPEPAVPQPAAPSAPAAALAPAAAAERHPDAPVAAAFAEAAEAQPTEAQP